MTDRFGLFAQRNAFLHHIADRITFRGGILDHGRLAAVIDKNLRQFQIALVPGGAAKFHQPHDLRLVEAKTGQLLRLRLEQFVEQIRALDRDGQEVRSAGQAMMNARGREQMAVVIHLVILPVGEMPNAFDLQLRVQIAVGLLRLANDRQ